MKLVKIDNLPITWIKKDAKTIIQPHPPSGGEGCLVLVAGDTDCEWSIEVQAIFSLAFFLSCPFTSTEELTVACAMNRNYKPNLVDVVSRDIKYQSFKLVYHIVEGNEEEKGKSK